MKGNKCLLWLILSLTLGLAPFSEPHILGKIQWVAGGANGMAFMDWFDLVLHSTPWIGLLICLGRFAYLKIRQA